MKSFFGISAIVHSSYDDLVAMVQRIIVFGNIVTLPDPHPLTLSALQM